MPGDLRIRPSGDPSTDGSSPTSREWRRTHARRLAVTDVLVIAWATFGAAFVTLGASGAMTLRAPVGPWWISYLVISLVVTVVWTAALAAVGSRGHRVIGTGSTEYKAIFQSAALTLVAIALVSFLVQAEFSRAYVLTLLSAGLVALMLSRWLWRRWLRGQRYQGRYMSKVMMVGSLAPASKIAGDLGRHRSAGYRVVAACISDAGDATTLDGTLVPVVGGVGHLTEAMKASGADTVIVTDGHGLDPAELRELSWSLEPGRQHLVMAPSLTDIAGPRIHARPVAGLPLIHVETPRYEGIDRFVKRLFDIVGSGAILLVLSVPLIAVAVIVKTTSPGGIFFSHERIGKNGHPFRMLKFRSMRSGADNELAALLEAQGSSDKPLFKIENDPRITKIGGFIRRYSIDEIPQLINVLRGDMSLVGPRPQVAKEVALYDDAASRRLFVKPGMTGLWQVRGRSNLDWDESVRLDLFYVENWSLAADLSIMFRTVRAVLAKDGAV